MCSKFAKNIWFKWINHEQKVWEFTSNLFWYLVGVLQNLEQVSYLKKARSFDTWIKLFISFQLPPNNAISKWTSKVTCIYFSFDFVYPVIGKKSHFYVKVVCSNIRKLTITCSRKGMLLEKKKAQNVNYKNFWIN